MKAGCFALVDPFSTLGHHLERIAGMGFKFADVTDRNPGSSLGRDYGFAATALSGAIHSWLLAQANAEERYSHMMFGSVRCILTKQ